MLTYYQQKSTHITGYKKLLQEEEKKISCLDMAVSTKQRRLEKKLEVFPLRKPSTD